MTVADIQPVWRADEPQKLYHIIIVVERLAYSHQNDSVYPFARVALRSYHLTEYLARTQMTDKPANSRRTEAAAHPTADLSRDADGIAMLVLHNDALDALPVRQTKQILDRSVDRRHEPPRDRRHTDLCTLREACAKRRR